MINIKRSNTADSRNCDWSKVSKDTLLQSSLMHIDDVRKGMEFMASRLLQAAEVHDHDKISDIDDFHANFITGFDQRNWLDNHYKVNRHHLRSLKMFLKMLIY
jgi:hypothetical protein